MAGFGRSTTASLAAFPVRFSAVINQGIAGGLPFDGDG